MRGAVLIAAGMGLAVLGLQQASTWGWDDPATWGTIVAGVALLAAFVAVELRVDQPTARSADLRRPRVRGRQRGAVPALGGPSCRCSSSRACTRRSRSATTLRTPASICSLLRRLRSGGPDRRPDPRPTRGTPVGDRRLRGRRRRLLPLGAEMPDLDYNSQWYWIVMAGAGSASCSARRAPTRSTGSRRTATARSPASPRRSATSAQPRARDPGHDPRAAEQEQHRGARSARPACPPGRRTRSPTRSRSRAVGKPHRQLRRARRGKGPGDLQRRAARFRALQPHRLLRDGGRDGGRLRGRARCGCPRDG